MCGNPASLKCLLSSLFTSRSLYINSDARFIKKIRFSNGVLNNKLLVRYSNGDLNNELKVCYLGH